MTAEERSLVLIVHPDDERVFTSNGRHLPYFSPSSVPNLDVNVLTRYVQKILDLPFDIVLLRRECSVLLPRDPPHYFIYIFEIPRSSVSRIGKNETWVAKEEVPELCVEPSTDLVMNYLRQYAIHGLEINTERLWPFSKRGWYDRTSAWSRSMLSIAGFHPEELQQFLRGLASFILRLQSKCGAKFYVKSCHPRGIYNEAAVCLVLGTEMPDDFMRPLAVNLERDIILMKDLGSAIPSTDGYESGTETDERVLDVWGKIQLRAIPKKEQLIKGGVPVWDMEKFRSLFEEMFDDEDWWSFQQESMNEEERSKYDWATCKDMCLTRSEELCRKIGLYEVPLSLVHGDLNAGNVIVQEDSRLAFIDFAYTVWSFPFLDLLLTNFEEADEVEFYLELWCEYESMDRLKELYELIRAFGKLYWLLQPYHRFKYAEQSSREYYRQILFSFLELFFEESE